MEKHIDVVAALLTIAITYRRQEPPEKDDPKGALKSVLATYNEVKNELEKSS